MFGDQLYGPIIFFSLFKVLLFEDDIRFEPYFIEKVKVMKEEADRLLDWDLIYLGRKKMKSADEPWVSLLFFFLYHAFIVCCRSIIYKFTCHRKYVK